jgi:Flp pilus assembly pilin Flp
VSKLRIFAKDPKGATAVEYALLAACAALATVAALQSVGSSLVRLLGVANAGFAGG